MPHRRFRRWETRLPCRCRWEQGQTDGHVINFSYGGAAIAGENSPPLEGDDIVVIFPASQQDGVQLQAHVSWQRGPQFGVEFYASAEERRDKLLPLFQRCVAV